ncbi:rhodanese-related sulfurtransferase [Candidatus Babeliales bacterium]|nr:rhodanese-related sulfurtransferase [Candidatus Babeliales bacterium]MBP9843336.1 rhodanese-related sulfurtransferase [Candidatus Babeliales bacterium]
MGIIVLYYKYVNIENPTAIAKWQRSLCESLHLTGRIILAHEGINGTVSGSEEQAQQYIDAMNNHELFGNIDFKTTPGDDQSFPKLKISVKNEIVRLGVDPTMVTVKDTGIHLNPDQTHELLTNRPKDLIILETRNDYEWEVGRFLDAENPNIKSFREFPEYVDKNLERYKDKEVLMYCTGGVRCERATAYLVQKNVAKKVYQIEGGIVRYAEKYPDGFFRGKNYVFDNRVTVRINDDILAQCLLCKTPSDDYTNCINAFCNKHFVACAPCKESFNYTCSDNCKLLIANKETIERKEIHRR